jgi:heterodisulfide reductase subunit C2
VSHDEHGPPLTREIRSRTGIEPARCYQCGKCTAGCPMADEMPTRIQQIMRKIQQGREGLLEDPSIWLCLSCEQCSGRCPQEVEPARMVDALRELAMERAPGTAPRRIGAFHTAFLEQIKLNGRLYEFGLVMGYKLRSGALLDDVEAAPAMMARGKLALVPTRIDGLDDVRRIFRACEHRPAADSPDEEAP